MTTDAENTGALTVQVLPGPPPQLVVRGDLDLATTPHLTQALDSLIAAATSNVHLNLAGLTFCDSTGLSALLHAHKTLQDRHHRLVLDNPSRMLHQLLTTTGLATLFDLNTL